MDRRVEVRKSYERIATHFAATREYAWPEVETFVSAVTDEEQVAGTGLDLGCGNCRHAELLADRCEQVVGLDVSRGLLEGGNERANERDFHVHLVQGEATSLPFESDSFEVAIYVATLHHLSTPRQRVASLEELARVLTPTGHALVSAWSTAHDRFEERETGFDTTIEWTLPDGEIVDRYYHIYDPDEFEADLAKSSLEVVSSTLSSGNCYATVRGADSE